MTELRERNARYGVCVGSGQGCRDRARNPLVRRRRMPPDAMTSSSEAAEMTQLLALLDLQIKECSATRVAGTIAADERHHQPWGVVHGGLNTTAIETVATLGALEAVKGDRGQAVGVTNITEVLRPHRGGRLAVVGTPIQQGRMQQLGPVAISRADDDKLVARWQVRLHHVGAQASE